MVVSNTSSKELKVTNDLIINGYFDTNGTVNVDKKIIVKTQNLLDNFNSYIMNAKVLNNRFCSNE